MLDHILYASAALIALTAPFAEIPIFLAIVQGQSIAQVRMSAFKVALATLVILSGAAIGGTELLQLFGVSLAAFRAAAGFLLICVGLDMMQGGFSKLRSDSSNGAADGADHLMVPFVMPLTAGPASITAAITLAIREEGRLFGLPVGTLVAIGAATLVVLIVLMLAAPVDRVLGRRAARITERFFGVILVAVGFQMGMYGVKEFFFAV